MTNTNQELLDTLLTLEARLQTLDERRQGAALGEVPAAVLYFQQTYLRLTNQMRETSAALDYCLKVNRQVAALQAEETSALFEILEQLEIAADSAG
jgi:hypothetical protein